MTASVSSVEILIRAAIASKPQGPEFRIAFSSDRGPVGTLLTRAHSLADAEAHGRMIADHARGYTGREISFVVSAVTR